MSGNLWARDRYYWRHSEWLAENGSLARVARSSVNVDRQESTWTGAPAGVEMALSLLEEDCGPELAGQVAEELLAFMRRQRDQREPRPQHRPGSSPNRPLRRLLDQIAADPVGDYSLAGMARASGFSVRHLCRLFYEETGTSAKHYVERIRVEAARAQLVETDDGLAVISSRTGFNSMETMRRAFLRELGVTPGHYRLRHRLTP